LEIQRTLEESKIIRGLTQVPAFNDAFLGGTIGGAIVKDKLFFFAGADSEILNRAVVFGTGQLTPTPAGIATLAACFPESASVTALENYGPYAVKAGRPTPEGPIAQMDLANCVDVDMAGIQRTLAENFRQYSLILKLDYQTDKNHLYGRYIYSETLP